jgi:outer membrane receptor protein involved in Fe transport
MLAGFVKERSDTPLGGALLDVSGALGTPDLTANATLSYSIGDYSIRLQQRFVDKTIRNITWVEGVDIDDNSVSSGNYTSMGLTYGGETDSGGNWNVTFNVNNLFNRPPPIVASYSTSGAAQSLPSGYDLYGRRFQLSVNSSF